FVWASGRRDLKVTSHVEKLAASACKQASGDALWCGTCHDPHGGGASAAAAKTQAACVGCHQTAHRRQEQCASCHMPRAKASDAGHGVLTDHSIPRVPQPSVPPVPGDLVSFLGKADERALGLAWAERGDARARDHLLRAQPVDWAVRLHLAVLEPDRARAAALYEAVLRDRPGETAALVNLGTLYATAGRTAEAAALWERALAANPALEEAVLNLAQIRSAPEAEGLLRRYLELNPASRAAAAQLAAIRGKRIP
ncbi:MAG: cytochrome c3 family protein, partial [Acidobacteriota bacterium]